MDAGEATTPRWRCWSWCTISQANVARYRAIIEYDGTDFNGFQRQAQGERTVQEVLEAAIQAVTGQAATVLAAGRTDSGVHALGQVIAFDVDWRHGPEALARALNANLPPDVATQQVQFAGPGFHPRHSARCRTYQYKINNQPFQSPLLRRTTWHRHEPLELEAMAQASAQIIGVHDFTTFGRPTVGESTVRHVYRADWRQEGKLLLFEIQANAFLFRMVRSLVGSMCQVGTGEWSVSTFSEALAAADRSWAGPTAPPQGLCLLSVSYQD